MDLVGGSVDNIGGSVGVHSSTIRCCVQIRNRESTSINYERAGSHRIQKRIKKKHPTICASVLHSHQ